MDSIIIANLEMPRTRTLEIGGELVCKETEMASGKIVRDIIGFRKVITAKWEWLPAGLLNLLLPVIRGGAFLEIQYPDPAEGDTAGMFAVEIGNQKVFRFRRGVPYWYNVELTAKAQEVV